MYEYPKTSIPEYASILVPNVDNTRTDYLIHALAKQSKVHVLPSFCLYPCILTFEDMILAVVYANCVKDPDKYLSSAFHVLEKKKVALTGKKRKISGVFHLPAYGFEAQQ